MNKGIVLITGLVCTILALNEVNAVDSQEKDFVAFNRWLVKVLWKDVVAERNLKIVSEYLDKLNTDWKMDSSTRDSVKQALEELSRPTVKRAAELFVEFMGAHQCNDHLTITLKEIMKSNFLLYGEVSRVDWLMSSRMMNVFFMCFDFIDKKVDALYESSGLRLTMARFLDVVVRNPKVWRGPPGKELSGQYFRYIKERQDRSLDDDAATWASHLKKLAIGEPKDNFDDNYKKYLVEPCQQLASTLGDTFSQVYELETLATNFIMNTSITVRELLFGYKKCQGLLSMDKREISSKML